MNRRRASFLPAFACAIFFLMLVAAVGPASGTEEGVVPEGMVLIPAGTSVIGARADDGTAFKDEKPERTIYLDAFLIDRTEVTYGSYQQFLASLDDSGHGKCHRSEPESEVHAPETNLVSILAMDRPVVGVDWFDAFAFCEWAGKRLPTETEWERAARGSDGRHYPWGDDWSSGKANSRGNRDGFRNLAPVGSYPDGSSPFGLLDMAGNVWEWVGDAYETHYAWDQKPAEGDNHRVRFMVVRGGSWIDSPRDLRSSNRERRLRYNPTSRYDYVGFRCARSVPPPGK